MALSAGVTAPADAEVCPPGHYLLFLLNQSLIPSVARIVKIEGQPVAAARPVARPVARPAALQVPGPVEKDAAIAAKAQRPPVIVGLSSTCPYGLAACWGGAYVALRRLPGVAVVRPMADAKDSVAILYLDHDGLPDVANWPKEFEKLANASYAWRGVEVTVEGDLMSRAGNFVFAATVARPQVKLAPLEPADKVQLNLENGAPRALPEEERTAFENLSKRTGSSASAVRATVTGPLKQVDGAFVLEVRKFEI